MNSIDSNHDDCGFDCEVFKSHRDVLDKIIDSNRINDKRLWEPLCEFFELLAEHIPADVYCALRGYLHAIQDHILVLDELVGDLLTEKDAYQGAANILSEYIDEIGIPSPSQMSLSDRLKMKDAIAPFVISTGCIASSDSAWGDVVDYVLKKTLPEDDTDG